MPWYTRYLDSDFVAAQMSLFGLGYSLAAAPLNLGLMRPFRRNHESYKHRSNVSSLRSNVPVRWGR